MDSLNKLHTSMILNIHQELWLQALESGDFHRSTIGHLHTRTRKNKIIYCPLGVACAVLDKNLEPLGKSLYQKPDAFPCVNKLGITFEDEALIQALNDIENLPFQILSHVIRSNPSRFFSKHRNDLA
jgi:hypothetical protein